MKQHFLHNWSPFLKHDSSDLLLKIKNECKRIIYKLRAGELVQDVEPILMTLFRPSIEISKLGMSVLIFQGNRIIRLFCYLFL